MKILIAGVGKFGMTLAKQLSAEGHDITVIDVDSAALSNTQDLIDVMTVQGNCVAMKTLHQADVEHNDLLIASADNDEVNLLTCITAHGMNPDIHTIARIRNPEYTEQAASMRDAFGLSMSVNPEKRAAVEIERLLKLPGFLKRDTFAKGRAEIVELKLEQNSPLCGAHLTELSNIVKCKVLVCAVLRDGKVFIPSGSFELEEGDRIFVTAPTDDLSTLLKSLGIVTHKVKRVMLAGGSRIGYYLCQALVKSGVSVQVIERDEATCREFADDIPGICVVHGNASDEDLLESEGISQCDALVTLTGLDELNMVLSIYGQNFGVPQVITKLGRADNPKVLDKLPLGSVICPRKISCNGIVRYVRGMQIGSGAAKSVHLIADGEAEAVEFRADDKTLHLDEPLKNIRLKKDVLIACIIRGTQIDIPSGESKIKNGDTLIIVSAGGTVIRQLNDIFA